MMYRNFPLQQKEISLLPAARIMFGTVTIRLLSPGAALSPERETRSCLLMRRSKNMKWLLKRHW